jgi:putative SOS response-associated peptidase YedK
MPVILHPEDYDRWLDGETDDALLTGAAVSVAAHAGGLIAIAVPY